MPHPGAKNEGDGMIKNEKTITMIVKCCNINCEYRTKISLDELPTGSSIIAELESQDWFLHAASSAMSCPKCHNRQRASQELEQLANRVWDSIMGNSDSISLIEMQKIKIRARDLREAINK